MSWKSSLQVRDIESSMRIEIECKFCGQFRYEEVKDLQANRKLYQFYLDELETYLKCHVWGCGKAVRISIPSNVETEGFQGGLT